MRKLIWPTRIGLVSLALMFMPAEAGDGRLSGATLCAAAIEDGDCKEEIGSYCLVDDLFIPDATRKKP